MTLAACNPAADLPPGVTALSIRQLRVGMSEAEVVGLVGPPSFRKELEGSGGAVLLGFTRPGGNMRTYPNLGVVLVEGRVSNASATRHLWFDNEVVFFVSESHPAGWESPDLESAFAR